MSVKIQFCSNEVEGIYYIFFLLTLQFSLLSKDFYRIERFELCDNKSRNRWRWRMQWKGCVPLNPSSWFYCHYEHILSDNKKHVNFCLDSPLNIGYLCHWVFIKSYFLIIWFVMQHFLQWAITNSIFCMRVHFLKLF